MTGLVHFDLTSETVRLLAEATLALVLFTDASSIDVAGLRRDAGLVGRLLGVGLLLTIALGGFVAAAVTNPAVPIRIRRVLNVESGLNDGIATLFVLLSVLAHGLSAGPLATRYGRWIQAASGRRREPLPELEDRPELRPGARLGWVRRSTT